MSKHKHPEQPSSCKELMDLFRKCEWVPGCSLYYRQEIDALGKQCAQECSEPPAPKHPPSELCEAVAERLAKAQQNPLAEKFPELFSQYSQTAMNLLQQCRR